MPTVGDILEYLESIAPPALKMEWDNVGLLCGSRSTPVTKILVALDPFEHVCQEAADWGAELMVTHHPLIFQPLSSITGETSLGRGILTLCRHGISAVNAHTNLDRAEGGVNDVLAQKLGLSDITLVSQDGLLRCGYTPEKTLADFLSQVKTALVCPGLRFVDGGKPVRKVAVGGGSCADEMLQALDAGCDTFVTADIKYNQFWDAHDLGINLIDAGHFCTENPVIPVIAAKIAEKFPDIQVKISESHTDCMKFY
ncbi:MAG: Nif3-like dinuclear metal center hexameric protein [Oscillospiraceae bacterium]|nr:Nif3-like dinuclear metal center hexameric protein [Oscillospiraceae bacterium]